ncbi:MAG: hypothetical protein AB3N63_04890 [Puniceicoccaceae bacterium]
MNEIVNTPRGILPVITKILVLSSLLFLLSACQTATVTPTPDGQAVPAARDQGALASMVGSKVNASVTISGGKTVQLGKDLLQERLIASLVTSGYEVSEAGPHPDIRIQASYDATIFDQSGNYYLYEGTSSAKVVRTWDGKVIAQTRLKEKGPRILEQARALEDNALQVADELDAWLASAVKPSSIGLVASEVTVSRPLFNPRSYPSRFIERVQSIPGVTNVRYAGDDASGSFIFRVVYFPEQMPEGLLNKLRSIQSLNIR